MIIIPTETIVRYSVNKTIAMSVEYGIKGIASNSKRPCGSLYHLFDYCMINCLQLVILMDIKYNDAQTRIRFA